SKLVKNIFSHKIPVEVLPFSWTSVTLFLKENLEAKAEIRMSREGKVGPITTDNGNFIIDVYIGKRGLSPAELEREVKQVPGVVEVGIFSLKKPKKVILGSASGVKVLTR
ncbi:MAG: ribose 5-phosphate isomerase A, partial [Thermoprotei archaeon]